MDADKRQDPHASPATATNPRSWSLKQQSVDEFVQAVIESAYEVTDLPGAFTAVDGGKRVLFGNYLPALLVYGGVVPARVKGLPVGSYAERHRALLLALARRDASFVQGLWCPKADRPDMLR